MIVHKCTTTFPNFKAFRQITTEISSSKWSKVGQAENEKGRFGQ